MKDVIVPENLTPQDSVITKIEEFLFRFRCHEIKNSSKLLLYFDEKSNAYYLICHLDAKTLVPNCDLEASLDGGEEDDIYKLNRDVYEDQSAYKTMEMDSINGRSFEDLVLEYDTSYRPEHPLKVYGGQHRLKAISKAEKIKATVVHGIRVYFDLSRDQKVEIATINNTSIAVPNDLLDRMKEQLLGSKLRDWCQDVGLLGKNEDFADKKSPTVPTVRVARTLIVNFINGLKAQDNAFHQPIVCKSGGVDDDYLEIRETINWKDEKLLEMGRKFAQLHTVQRERVTNRSNDNIAEFARKALSMSVVASWGFAAGLFQKNSEYLKNHYALPDSVSEPDDPLNAKALSEARLIGVDKDTYRGLGARNDAKELGRMLEVFVLQATKATQKRITKQLANTAIQSYQAKKATYEANKMIGKI